MAGNTYTYDSANRLQKATTPTGRTTYLFDAAGNQTKITTPSLSRTTFGYDGENQLVKMRNASGDVVTYAYNGWQQRVRRDSPSGTSLFLWDGTNLKLESNAGVTQVDYTLAPLPESFAPVGVESRSTAAHQDPTPPQTSPQPAAVPVPQPQPYGNLVSQQRSGQSTFYHFDALGSAAALTTSTQTVSDSYTYRAFGDIAASSGTTTNPYQWVGREGYYRDEEASELNLGRRHYDTATGRFTTEDPIGYHSGDSNFYRYVGNNPIVSTDPSGLDQGPPIKISLEEKQRLWDAQAEIAQLQQAVRNLERDLSRERVLSPIARKGITLALEEIRTTLRRRIAEVNGQRASGSLATGGDPVAKLKLIEKLKIAIEKSIQSGKLKDDVVAKLQEVTSPGNLGRTAAFIAAYAAAHVSPLAPGLAVLDAYFIGSSAGELGLALYQLYLDLESATTEGELTSASDSLSSMLSGPIADSLLKLLTLGAAKGAAKGAAAFRKRYDLKISIDPSKLGSNLGNVEIKITRKGVPDRAQPADGRSLKAKAEDLEEEARKKREYDPPQTGKAKSLFEEFGVKPGQGLNLDVASAPDGQSYITYAFKDRSGNVVYVGRASGSGTPRKVLADRLRKGHEHFKEGLVPEVVDVQGSKLASQGAEEVFIQGFREQGAKLTNLDESLSFDRKERIQKSLGKVEAYLEDLKQRKTK